MKRVLAIAAVMWALLIAVFMPVSVMAADTITIGTVLKVEKDTNVYQEASETSGTVAVLKADTAVYVTDNAVDGWCGISSRELSGYVKTESLIPLTDSDEMNLEFEQIGNNYHMIFNEVQQLKKQHSQEKIWGVVIVLLVAGIFAAGIIPVLKKNGKNENTGTTS